MAAYTMLAVPTDLVPTVIKFIENHGEPQSHGAETPRSDGEFVYDWDPETLKRAYRDSNPGLRDVFDYLASHPGEWVDFDQVGEAIGAEYGWQTVAGRLGGFQRRLKRYGVETFPWHYREEEGRGRMEMPVPVAEVIREAART